MSSEMIIPANIASDTLCRHCLNDSIELYDCYGKPMNYRLMLSMNNFSSVDSTRNYISYFKCNRCGAKFPILWDNSVPIPLQTDTRINNFVLKFIKEEDE